MSGSHPNLVLVSIDSLRGDHCGFLGDKRELTPTLDAFAAEGVAFENAVAPGPQTFSSMPAIFTGKSRSPTTLENYPQDSHWERRLAGIDDHLRRYASLPERLRERGYDTAGVTPNPWTSSASGFDRGFNQFVDFSEQGSKGKIGAVAKRIPGIDTDSRPVELVLNMVSGSEFFAQWETLYGEIQRVREQLSEPYFLWVFILDTHFPFITSRAHRQEQSLFEMYYSAYRSSEPMRGNDDGMASHARKSLERSYRDTVRASDAFLKRLQRDFAEDDPTIIVHSDHGESFGEHGNYGHHHRQVYDENIHVPYVVYNAGVSDTIETPISLRTVYDTVLTIAQNGTFDPTASTEPYAIATSECGRNRTVRGSRFKYLEHGDESILFDIKSDPDEQQDLSAVRRELSQTLERQLARLDRHTVETDRLHQATKVLSTLKQV